MKRAERWCGLTDSTQLLSCCTAHRRPSQRIHRRHGLGPGIYAYIGFTVDGYGGDLSAAA